MSKKTMFFSLALILLAVIAYSISNTKVFESKSTVANVKVNSHDIKVIESYAAEALEKKSIAMFEAIKLVNPSYKANVDCLGGQFLKYGEGPESWKKLYGEILGGEKKVDAYLAALDKATVQAAKDELRDRLAIK